MRIRSGALISLLNGALRSAELERDTALLRIETLGFRLELVESRLLDAQLTAGRRLCDEVEEYLMTGAATASEE